jgi:Glu-tRNA(Gln) amidotransferase subunit E-like FAD-binding protein
MYPETDIPPVPITEQHLKEVLACLPELPEQKLKRLMKERNLNDKLAKQLMDSEYVELFETIVKESSVSPTAVAAYLTETLKALKRDGVQTENLSADQIREVFRSIGSGEVAKEALPELTSWLCNHCRKSAKDAIDGLELRMISEKELEAIVETIMETNASTIMQRGRDAFDMIMGLVMKEVRGKAAADSVTTIVRRKLAAVKQQ